jgi:P4 family phage/plasmid primase-like protien
MYKNYISKEDKLINEQIRKTANQLRKDGLDFYTGYLVEIANKTQGEKPKKYLARNKKAYTEKGEDKTGICHSKINVGDWKDDKISPDDNCIVLITGEKSKNIILVDWDLCFWNKETQSFEINDSILELYNETLNEIWGDEDPRTYTETTGNNGVHWLFKYDPIKLGGIIKEHNGFKINNISCGDIKADAGLCYMAPTSYKGLDGNYKEYEAIDSFNFETIQELPDFLIKKLGFKIKYNDETKNIETKAPKTPIINNNHDIGYLSDENTNNEIQPLPKLTKLETERDFIIGYLNCIDADPYDNWLKVSLILGKLPEYRELYHQWAKQSNKYDFNFCEGLLNKSNGELTLKSLAYLAKQTTKYNDVFGSVIEEPELINMIEHFNEKNIAEFYYKHTKNEIYYDDKNNKWFILNEKCIWDYDENFTHVKKQHFMNFIISKLKNYHNYVKQKLKQMKNEEIENPKFGASNAKNIPKYIDNIGKTTFLKNCIEMLKNYYSNPAIVNILTTQDTNRYKFCFTNKLFDLKNKNFRDIKPEDYITITTNYDYNDKPTKIQEVNKILGDILDSKSTDPDPKYCSDLDVLLNKIANSMIGANLDRRFNILSGKGCNGKSFLTENFIGPAFGSYYGSISSSYFTKQDQHSNSATPEIADKRYIRYLSMSEPEATERFQSSKIKKISGNDEIQARQLYCKGERWKPQFTPFCLCNDIPTLNAIDRATLDRIDIIEFKNQFVDEIEYVDKAKTQQKHINHRQKDTELASIIQDDTQYRDSFIYILIDKFIKMDKKNIKISKNIEDKKTTYINENNPIISFIEDCIVIADGEKISSQNLFNEYTEYCFENNIKDKLGIVKFVQLMKFNDYTNEYRRNVNYWMNIDTKTNQDLKKNKKKPETKTKTKKSNVILDF